jgi:hypothetical protein
MMITLASDMVRKSLDPFVAKAEQRDDFSPDEAREFLASCVIPVVVLERLWQLTHGFLGRGIESKYLAFLLKEFLDVLEIGIKAFGAARGKVAATQLPAEERAEGVLMLEQAGRRAEEMRDEVSALLARLTPWEVDPSVLPGERGKKEAKGYTSLDDLTARLLS